MRLDRTEISKPYVPSSPQSMAYAKSSLFLPFILRATTNGTFNKFQTPLQQMPNSRAEGGMTFGDTISIMSRNFSNVSFLAARSIRLSGIYEANNSCGGHLLITGVGTFPPIGKRLTDLEVPRSNRKSQKIRDLRCWHQDL